MLTFALTNIDSMFMVWTAVKYGYYGVACVKSTYETSMWAYRLTNKVYNASPFTRNKLEKKMIALFFFSFNNIILNST